MGGAGAYVGSFLKIQTKTTSHWIKCTARCEAKMALEWAPGKMCPMGRLARTHVKDVKDGSSSMPKQSDQEKKVI